MHSKFGFGFVIPSIFVAVVAAAQPPSPGSWSGIFGSGQGEGESGRAVIRTMDGGYAIAGTSFGLTAIPVGFWLLKLDGTGEVEWQKVYSQSFPAPRYLTALAEAADGGLVMAGFVGSAPSVWMLKVDVLGSVVWSNLYSTFDPGFGGGFNQVSSLIRTSDDGFAFAGIVAGQFGLAKIDSGGALQWIKAYPAGTTGGSFTNIAYSVVEAPDGGFALTGSHSGVSGYRVLKTDSAGGIQWEETLGSGESHGITNGFSGGFIVTGNNFFGIGTIALDPAGAVLWQQKYTLPFDNEDARGIVPSSGGGYAIAGASSAGVGGTAGPPQATILEVDASGAPLWAKRFAAYQSSVSTFHALVPTLDGGFLAVGDDVVGADSRLLAVKVDAGGGFVGCLDEEFSVTFAVTATTATPTPLADTAVDEFANTTVAVQSVTSAPTDAAERIVCRATLPAELAAATLTVDAHASGSSDVNGIAEPGEKFITEPAWTNFGPSATFLSGHASAKSDTNGLDTTDPDLDADYGTVASLATADCYAATGDCYMFQFQSIPRPSQHWDTYFDETLSTSDPHHRYAKRWTVHAGLSFSDVSPSSGFYPFIENLFHNGVTAGCGGESYCPDSPVTRAQMAVFLLKGEHGGSYEPPACSATLFTDEPCPGGPFVDWVNQLASEGITAGCGNGNYCPANSVTRGQMAVFLLKGEHGGSYVPPACSLTVFNDVACPGAQFVDFINQLAAENITGGCGGGNYCPNSPTDRGQMAVFLVKTFGLQLYGP